MAITAHVVSSEVCGGDKSIKKYTVYKIVVEYGQQSWVFYRRYNEFSKLCDSVSNIFLIQLLCNYYLTFAG